MWIVWIYFSKFSNRFFNHIERLLFFIIIKLPNVALHVIILIYHGVFFSSAYSFYAVSSVFFNKKILYWILLVFSLSNFIFKLFQKISNIKYEVFLDTFTYLCIIIYRFVNGILRMSFKSQGKLFYNLSYYLLFQIDHWIAIFLKFILFFI